MNTHRQRASQYRRQYTAAIPATDKQNRPVAQALSSQIPSELRTVYGARESFGECDLFEQDGVMYLQNIRTEMRSNVGNGLLMLTVLDGSLMILIGDAVDKLVQVRMVRGDSVNIHSGQMFQIATSGRPAHVMETYTANFYTDMEVIDGEGVQPKVEAPESAFAQRVTLGDLGTADTPLTGGKYRNKRVDVDEERIAAQQSGATQPAERAVVKQQMQQSAGRGAAASEIQQQAVVRAQPLNAKLKEIEGGDNLVASQESAAVPVQPGQQAAVYNPAAQFAGQKNPSPDAILPSDETA